MSISTSASRFACLPDDEAADWKAPKSKAKSPTKSTEKKVQDNKPKDKNKPSKAQQEAKALQNLAFGGQKKSKSKKKGKGGDNQSVGRSGTLENNCKPWGTARNSQVQSVTAR